MLTPSTTRVAADPAVMVPLAAEYAEVGSAAVVAAPTAVKFVAVAMLGALK